MAGPAGPRAGQIVLADAPIFLLEVCLLALLALAAGPALGLPWWGPPLVLASGLALLAALRATHLRLSHRAIAGGLAVLADDERRAGLFGLIAALTALALVRGWLILVGFGLPSGPAESILLLISLGAIGLLPLGLGTGPAATVAAVGAGGVGPAAAAGLAVSASTLLAVLIYAVGAWAWMAARTAPAEPEPLGGEVIALPLRASLPPGSAPPSDLDLAA